MGVSDFARGERAGDDREWDRRVGRGGLSGASYCDSEDHVRTFTSEDTEKAGGKLIR